MAGWQSQQTGDAGQAIVEAELARAGFLVGRLDPDPGEDLWAEVDGRRASASGELPLRALFQVKATAEPIDECILDVEVDHLRRWAAQPLPVFVVGSTATQRLFLKSVDDIITEDLEGEHLFDLETKTKRIRINPTTDFGAAARSAIEAHYGPLRLNLAGIADHEIKAHYFEILSQRNPGLLDRIPIVGWFVLWKSAPRPQHFSAMISELIRRATELHKETRPVPALFIFHIYRSIEDRHFNLALARVDVANPNHPKNSQIREVMGIKDVYRVRPDRDVEPLREFMQSKVTSADEFRQYAAKVGSAFDLLAEKVLAKGTSSSVVWDDNLNRDFSAVDDLWNDGPFAPPECNAVEEFPGRYYGHLLTHNHVERRRSSELPAETVSRLLRGEEAKLASCKGAWKVILDIGR